MRRALLRIVALVVALVAALFCVPAGAVPQVFLVQDSGWMEPFYTDPASPFKPLVGAVIDAAASPGDPLVLAAFNQALPGAPSPRALLAGRADAATPAAVRAALARLEPAHKPGSAALADTDLGEAVRAAMTHALGGRPGLIWVFTNNRNSPNNDPATARRNREFYALIHDGAAIDTALAWPLRMPVHGAAYQANGLMIYVYAVGEPATRALDALLATGRLRAVLTETPARLKPLDRDTVRLRPVRVEEAPGVGLALGPGGVLDVDVDSGARSPRARVRWRLENTIYPYTITSAMLSATSTLAGEGHPLELDADAVRQLAPGASVPLASTVALPVAQLPARWSLQALRAAGSAYQLPGRIELHLAHQQLALAPAFRQRMAELFPGDPLPDMFVPPPAIHASTAVLPLQVRVHVDSTPLLALAAGALALLGAAATGSWAWHRPRLVRLNIDGEPRVLRARAGTTQPVYDHAGTELATLKTTLFGHQLLNLRPGAQVRLGR